MSEEQFKATIQEMVASHVEENVGNGKELTRKDASFLTELSNDLGEANWSVADVFMLKDIADRYSEES